MSWWVKSPASTTLGAGEAADEQAVEHVERRVAREVLRLVGDQAVKGGSKPGARVTASVAVGQRAVPPRRRRHRAGGVSFEYASISWCTQATVTSSRVAQPALQIGLEQPVEAGEQHALVAVGDAAAPRARHVRLARAGRAGDDEPRGCALKYCSACSCRSVASRRSRSRAGAALRGVDRHGTAARAPRAPRRCPLASGRPLVERRHPAGQLVACRGGARRRCSPTIRDGSRSARVSVACFGTSMRASSCASELAAAVREPRRLPDRVAGQRTRGARSTCGCCGCCPAPGRRGSAAVGSPLPSRQSPSSPTSTPVVRLHLDHEHPLARHQHDEVGLALDLRLVVADAQAVEDEPAIGAGVVAERLEDLHLAWRRARADRRGHHRRHGPTLAGGEEASAPVRCVILGCGPARRRWASDDATAATECRCPIGRSGASDFGALVTLACSA